MLIAAEGSANGVLQCRDAHLLDGGRVNECRLVLDTNIFVAGASSRRAPRRACSRRWRGTLSDDLAPDDASGDRAGAAPRPAA